MPGVGTLRSPGYRGADWDGAGADGLAPSMSCTLLNGVGRLLVRILWQYLLPGLTSMPTV